MLDVIRKFIIYSIVIFVILLITFPNSINSKNLSYIIFSICKIALLFIIPDLFIQSLRNNKIIAIIYLIIFFLIISWR